MILPDIPVRNYWKYYPHTMAEKASGGRWIAFPWLDHLALELFEGILKGGGRFIVEAPPRHGKSEFISHWLPCWFLEFFSHKRVIISTYSDTYSESWGRRVRDELIYNPNFTVKLSDGSKSASEFSTTEGGGLKTVGVGGGLTGRGGDLIIVDDPVKNWEEAASETYRQKTLDWYDTVLSTRCEPGATIIILMTRWHEDDLAGAMIKRGGWKVLRYPAIAESEDTLGRKPGEALCPERYDLKALLTIRDGSPDGKGSKGLPIQFWNALYQQRPSALEGNILKRGDFRHWDEYNKPEEFDEILISMDTSVEKTKKADFTVAQVWGKAGANFYLLDQVREQMGMTRQIQVLQALSLKWPTAWKKIIEKKTNGPAIRNLLQNTLPGIILFEPQGSKEERAMVASVYLASGNVYVPGDDREYPWAEPFKDECANFPNGSNDDQVDAMSQALIEWNGTFGSYLEKITKV